MCRLSTNYLKLFWNLPGFPIKRYVTSIFTWLCLQMVKHFLIDFMILASTFYALPIAAFTLATYAFCSSGDLLVISCLLLSLKRHRSWALTCLDHRSNLLSILRLILLRCSLSLIADWKWCNRWVRLSHIHWVRE